jgi:hypothetical protein
MLARKSTENSSLKLRIWPSFDFTLADSKPPAKRTEKKYLPDSELPAAVADALGVSPYLPVLAIADSVQGVAAHFDESDPDRAERFMGLFEGLLKHADRFPDWLPVRGLSDATNLNKAFERQVARTGVKGISSYGRRMLRSGVRVCSEGESRKNFYFGTLTLPECDEATLQAIASDWSTIVHRFFQELRRELARVGLPEEYLYVSEVQPKRFYRTGRCFLHLHYFVRAKLFPFEDWRINRGWSARVWASILAEYYPDGTDFSSATQFDRCRRSPENELAKYLSKSGRICRDVVEAGQAEFLPKQWWGMARSISRAVRSRVVELVGEVADEFLELLDRLVANSVLCARPVELGSEADCSTGCPSPFLVLGYVGFFKDEALATAFCRSGQVADLLPDLQRPIKGQICPTAAVA